MKILSFDLELNQNPAGAKIIEIGACIGDIKTGEVVDEFAAFVNPQETLQPEIVELTGITQPDVDTAENLVSGYRALEQFAKKNKCLTLPLVWGVGDGPALRKELGNQEKWRFGRRELDAKAVYQAYCMVQHWPVRSGLSKAMAKLGLTFRGSEHRAKDDAINTFYIYKALLGKFQMEGTLK